MASCNCRHCGSRLRVRSSYRAASAQVRYVECPNCRKTGKQLVPADTIFRRKR